jgi:hypothetical protein
LGQLHELPLRSIAVRFTPISRPQQDGFNATFCAITGPEQSQQILLDHLVGEREEIVGDIEAERPGGLEIEH